MAQHEQIRIEFHRQSAGQRRLFLKHIRSFKIGDAITMTGRYVSGEEKAVEVKFTNWHFDLANRTGVLIYETA